MCKLPRRTHLHLGVLWWHVYKLHWLSVLHHWHGTTPRHLHHMHPLWDPSWHSCHCRASWHRHDLLGHHHRPPTLRHHHGLSWHAWPLEILVVLLWSAIGCCHAVLGLWGLHGRSTWHCIRSYSLRGWHHHWLAGCWHLHCDRMHASLRGAGYRLTCAMYAWDCHAASKTGLNSRHTSVHGRGDVRCPIVCCCNCRCWDVVRLHIVIRPVKSCSLNICPYKAEILFIEHTKSLGETQSLSQSRCKK